MAPLPPFYDPGSDAGSMWQCWSSSSVFSYIRYTEYTFPSADKPEHTFPIADKPEHAVSKACCPTYPDSHA